MDTTQLINDFLAGNEEYLSRFWHYLNWQYPEEPEVLEDNRCKLQDEFVDAIREAFLERLSDIFMSQFPKQYKKDGPGVPYEKLLAIRKQFEEAVKQAMLDWYERGATEEETENKNTG